MSESTWTRERAKIASLSRSRKADDPELFEARQNFKYLKLSEHVARVVSEAPPMTDAQLARIAALLRPSAGGDAS